GSADATPPAAGRTVRRRPRIGRRTGPGGAGGVDGGGLERTGGAPPARPALRSPRAGSAPTRPPPGRLVGQLGRHPPRNPLHRLHTVLPPRPSEAHHDHGVDRLHLLVEDHSHRIGGGTSETVLLSDGPTRRHTRRHS